MSVPQTRRCVAFTIALVLVVWTTERPRAVGIEVFTATLTGAQQVPAVASAGTGAGTVILNAAEDQIVVNLTFSGLTTPAILAHIHGPATADANAVVLFDFAAVLPNATSGTIPPQTFPITPTQVAQLRAGLYYFNVHSGNFPGGEIRGQIGLAAVQFTTTLTGAQQVPPVVSQGTGTGIVALNAAEDKLFVNMSFSGLTSPAILAHIHGPAAAGANAVVLFDFAAVVPNATSGSIPQQTFAITPAQVADLKAGLY
jgi:predicted RNase H-like nuclease